MGASGMGQGLVVVTGGSRGIGAAVAALAARRGSPVVLNYAGDADAAHGLVRELADGGGWGQAVRADLGSEDGVLRLFEAADQVGVPLAGLVNNAGITGGFARLDQLQDASLRRVLAVNVAGRLLRDRRDRASRRRTLTARR